MPVPGHVAFVMDGNRRWARRRGFGSASVGHRYGADHLEEVLGWCAEAGIRHVTVFVVSADNLRKREAGEISYLMAQIERVATDRLARPDTSWRLHLAGRLDLLPDSTAAALIRAWDATATRDAPYRLTVAVGYDGRGEVVDALTSLLTRAAAAGASLDGLARTLTADDITAQLATEAPDLIIRTSGERRLSGFLLWQSVGAELYFCDQYWPGFGKRDLQRALRSYGERLTARATTG